jgi:hypothetical protein
VASNESCSHGNLLVPRNVTPSHNLDAGRSLVHKLGVGVAVVVGKACRAHEQTHTPVTGTDDDAKVALFVGEGALLFGRNDDRDARQVLDGLVAADEATRRDAGLLRDNGVAVGRVHLPRAVGHVYLRVAAKVAAEVVALGGRLERGAKLAQAVEGEQLGLGGVKVAVDDNLGLDDLGNVIFAYAAGRVVCLAVLWNLGPVLYVVDERIRQDVVIVCQLLERERLLLLGGRGRHDGRGLSWVYAELEMAGLADSLPRCLQGRLRSQGVSREVRRLVEVGEVAAVDGWWATDEARKKIRNVRGVCR